MCIFGELDVQSHCSHHQSFEVPLATLKMRFFGPEPRAVYALIIGSNAGHGKVLRPGPGGLILRGVRGGGMPIFQAWKGCGSRSLGFQGFRARFAVLLRIEPV